ncbi:unnamed protein product, partial [Heterotrigona itama]
LSSTARYNLSQESRDSFLSQKIPKRGATTLKRFVPFRGRGFCSGLWPPKATDSSNVGPAEHRGPKYALIGT